MQEKVLVSVHFNLSQTLHNKKENEHITRAEVYITTAWLFGFTSISVVKAFKRGYQANNGSREGGAKMAHKAQFVLLG